MSGTLAPIDPAAAQRWRPYVRGPREQWLSCEGGLAARVVACVHFAWPFARGHWRMSRILRGFPGSALRAVPFRSSCGIPIRLDITGDAFLYLSGRLPPEPLEVAVASRLGREGDVFLDVGAHRGLYALHVLGRLGERGRYLAFEPSPSNQRFLHDAFAETRPRLELFEVAISDADGEAGLADDGRDIAHVSERGGGLTPVRTARLDSMLADVPVEGRCVVAKLDIEGYEARAIRGASGLARRGVRPIFISEFIAVIHRQTRGDVVAAIEDTFGAGYRYFAMDQASGRWTAFAPTAAPGEGVRNIVAIPPESLPRLEGVFAPGDFGKSGNRHG